MSPLSALRSLLSEAVSPAVVSAGVELLLKSSLGVPLESLEPEEKLLRSEAGGADSVLSLVASDGVSAATLTSAEDSLLPEESSFSPRRLSRLWVQAVESTRLSMSIWEKNFKSDCFIPFSDSGNLRHT